MTDEIGRLEVSLNSVVMERITELVVQRESLWVEIEALGKQKALLKNGILPSLAALHCSMSQVFRIPARGQESHKNRKPSRPKQLWSQGLH